MTKKLELKHIAPYLPYRLKVGKIHILHHGSGIGSIGHILTTESENYKPMLRPLSYYADINSNEMVDLNCDLLTQIEINEFALKYINVGDLHYSTVQICLENYIDVFGLIDKGLAIPIK